MLFRRGFILFGVFWFVKAGCQNGMSVPSVFFLCPALLRSNLFSCVQDVTGNPQGLSDCLSVSLRDSRISGYFREGAEIRESRGDRFYFLSMSGCSLVDGGQGKLVGRNFNHFKSSTSLTSYLRLLILRLEAGVPSKKFSLNTVLSSVNEISCVGCFIR